SIDAFVVAVFLHIEVGGCVEALPQEAIEGPFVMNRRLTKNDGCTVERFLGGPVPVDESVKKLEDLRVMVAGRHIFGYHATDLASFYCGLGRHAGEVLGGEVIQVFAYY